MGTVIATSQIVSVLVGFIIPLVVGAVTKQKFPSWMKASMLAALAAVSGVLTPLLNAGKYNWRQIAISVALTWAVAVASHYGLFKHFPWLRKLLGQLPVTPAPVTQVPVVAPTGGVTTTYGSPYVYVAETKPDQHPVTFSELVKEEPPVVQAPVVAPPVQAPAEPPVVQAQLRKLPAKRPAARKKPQGPPAT